MAKIDDLVARVEDEKLRRELEGTVAEMRRKQRFGLVFEEHLPETTLLPGYPVQVGEQVVVRTEPSSRVTYRVREIEGQGADALASLEALSDSGETRTVRCGDLMVVKGFGEPIYPGLTPLGEVRRGGDDRPNHAVISAENFHAVQMLLYLYEGKVDCLYLDPPYNTGARDWTYNNAYVDSNDSWRHSKWLSFMDKRLRLAKRLLKPDGVLIITIDEHEIHHLGLLLEKAFPEYLRYLITITVSARGNYKNNFSRVEEYAFFVVPNTGTDIINGSSIDLLPHHGDIEIDFDDEIPEIPDEIDVVGARTTGEVLELRHARRRGPDSSRRDRPSMFYPIYINETEKRVIVTGDPIELDTEPDFSLRGGLRPIWPIDADGSHRRWRWGRDRMEEAIGIGDVRVGQYNRRLDSWTINIAIRREDALKKLKTVWRHTSHDAGTYGSDLLAKFLGGRGLFSFPKSLYAVKDCLAAVTRNRPNALIVDFFAGSGTTLHATCLLNADDNGSRRAVIVTNNNVKDEDAQGLRARNLHLGDPEFETHGIYQQVTKPRCEAAVSGRRPDGNPVLGSYLNGRRHQDGFPENLQFFRLDYLDPNDVDLGKQYDAIVAMLWLAAGGIGTWETASPAMQERGYSLPPDSTYGVLLRESRFTPFRNALDARPDVTHVWLVTDSEEAFAEMRADLPGHLNVSMLYRDYLRSFRINTEVAR